MTRRRFYCFCDYLSNTPCSLAPAGHLTTCSGDVWSSIGFIFILLKWHTCPTWWWYTVTPLQGHGEYVFIDFYKLHCHVILGSSVMMPRPLTWCHIHMTFFPTDTFTARHKCWFCVILCVLSVSVPESYNWSELYWRVNKTFGDVDVSGSATFVKGENVSQKHFHLNIVISKWSCTVSMTQNNELLTEHYGFLPKIKKIHIYLALHSCDTKY